MFTAAGAAVCGVLENGVRTAYAVIDEYMRRGQEAARGVFNDPNRRGAMSDSSGNFGGGFNNWNNPMGAMAAMAAQWMAAMQAWSQMWSSYMPPGWQQAAMNPFAFAQGTPAVAVMVKLTSARPAEVVVNMNPTADPSGLICEPLRAESGSGVPIGDVTIARDGAVIQVGVKIGDQQAAGKYGGLIRRKTDQGVVGEVMVTVS